jgi:hypothetical protein
MLAEEWGRCRAIRAGRKVSVEEASFRTPGIKHYKP